MGQCETIRNFFNVNLIWEESNLSACHQRQISVLTKWPQLAGILVSPIEFDSTVSHDVTVHTPLEYLME